MYLGFDAPLPVGLVGLYAAVPGSGAEGGTVSGPSPFAQEGRSADGWAELAVLDGRVRFRRSGTVQFADGPAVGAAVSASYRTGGGPQGNVPAGTLTELRSAVPYVSGAVNPVAAQGDAAGEQPSGHTGTGLRERPGHAPAGRVGDGQPRPVRRRTLARPAAGHRPAHAGVHGPRGRRQGPLHPVRRVTAGPR
ncbi:hypothetical protein GCM10010329_33190 [Streptomyces spiroverticillatus]|uniref:Uncharacterized protein n=1 Tax=Streptomyces finlayi TaxID=67296 RepID=A0A918WWL8_9ACTN|nr:hypothetical protein [Streptomyces finlayi]GHA07815.1 hypothetical protein GCM10010329_33190 [Streptomyces spiroverticillatus]GHC91018.1 hypothetical protein GCM10010334_25600 [Streptomyces finlayi]